MRHTSAIALVFNAADSAVEDVLDVKRAEKRPRQTYDGALTLPILL